jgi:hypothetical protein
MLYPVAKVRGASLGGFQSLSECCGEENTLAIAGNRIPVTQPVAVPIELLRP